MDSVRVLTVLGMNHRNKPMDYVKQVVRMDSKLSFTAACSIKLHFASKKTRRTVDDECSSWYDKVGHSSVELGYEKGKFA